MCSDLRPPVLAFENISFSYGALQVLFDVSFALAPAEVLALVGANGAGKSATLRVAAGLERPFAGRVLLDGRDVTGVPAEERLRAGLSLMVGGHAIFGDLSVDENLRIGATLLRGTNRAQAAIANAFESFPILARRRSQLASSLSGGEQQMLAFAKALLPDPKVLLIDELSLGLAPAVVEQLLTAIRQVRDRGTSVVIVEQSIAVASEVAERAIYMERGAVRFEGEPRALLDEDIARATFLGAHA